MRFQDDQMKRGCIVLQSNRSSGFDRNARSISELFPEGLKWVNDVTTCDKEKLHIKSLT